MPVILPINTAFPTATVIKVRARTHYRPLMRVHVGRLWARVGTTGCAPWGFDSGYNDLWGAMWGFLIFFAVSMEGQLSTDVRSIREAPLPPSISPVLQLPPLK